MTSVEARDVPVGAGTVVEARELTRRYGEGETAVDALRGVEAGLNSRAENTNVPSPTPIGGASGANQ